MIELFLPIYLMSILLFSLVMFFRLNQMSRHHDKMLHAVSNACEHDIKKRRSWGWRYNLLNEVSFNKRLFQFWRPLHSFYDDGMTGEEIWDED